MSYNFCKWVFLFLFQIVSIVSFAQSDSLYRVAVKKADSCYEFRFFGRYSNDHDPKNIPQYEQAKMLYSKALKMKPGETYPANRIYEIDRVLNYFKSLPLVVAADSLFGLDKYKEAKSHYKSVDSLFSTDYVKDQIVLSDDATQMPNTDSCRKLIHKIFQTNKICRSIDASGEDSRDGIREGEIRNKEGKSIGGFTTYYRENKTKDTLYRIKNFNATDAYIITTFYYQNKKLIKAMKTIRTGKGTYNVVYYFDNGISIKARGEKFNDSNAQDVLKEGLKFQDDFDKEKVNYKMIQD